jgi:hypothetical protein
MVQNSQPQMVETTRALKPTAPANLNTDFSQATYNDEPEPLTSIASSIIDATRVVWTRY